MPSVYDLKPAFQKMLRPAVRRLAAWSVTANQLTVAACLLSLGFAYALTVHPMLWLWLPLFLFARMALNAMDGMLAREHGQKSRLGAILNELADVIADAALLLPLAYLPGWDPLWVGVAIFGSTLVEFAGLAAGSPRRHDGPFGKSDRAVALGAIGIAIGLGWPVPSAWIPLIWILLCGVTVVNRIRGALRT
jgi:CDP-diacylglycerol--glycerol-3-phosphate 3-phosphatidyltransferase